VFAKILRDLKFRIAQHLLSFTSISDDGEKIAALSSLIGTISAKINSYKGG
jgi:hypothetical protein